MVILKLPSSIFQKKSIITRILSQKYILLIYDPPPARGSELDLHSVVDPAPHGAGAPPGSGSWVICSGSQFSLKIRLFNFLPIKVKNPKKKCLTSICLFSSPYTSEFNFKLSNLNPKKSIFPIVFSYSPSLDPERWLSVSFWEGLRFHADLDPLHRLAWRD